MAKKKISAFVFNDESIANTYGFYILTSGIELSRFEKNPVMLSDHWNNNSDVLGNWIDIKKEGTLLTGVPVFDTEDPDTARIAGKVERGFIKACSMGIIVDRENLTYIDGKIFLTKCELAEVSIVPVPSNANAVRLMHNDGKVMTEAEVQSLCLSIVPDGKSPELNLNNNNMKRIILSASSLMALGFDDQPTEGLDQSTVENKIKELSAKLKNVTTENEGLKLAAETAKEAQEALVKKTATEAVQLAITQGKIPADKKEAFVNLGISSPEVLTTTLASIPAKQNFGAQINNSTLDGKVNSMDDFEKLSHEEKLSFKANQPEDYKKLFN